MLEDQGVEQVSDDNISIEDQYRAPTAPMFGPNVLRGAVSSMASALTAQDICH
jgi:hypothetical protein